MARFRSKPALIDAVLFDGRLVGEPDGSGGVLAGTCPAWLPACIPVTGLGNSVDAGELAIAGTELLIGTLEGTMRASPGDWIIRGTHGELYPCKPNVFRVKYQLA